MAHIDMKKALLNLAEENLKTIVKDIVRPVAEEYIIASETKIDDIILPFMDHLEKALIELADKVDGEVG